MAGTLVYSRGGSQGPQRERKVGGPWGLGTLSLFTPRSWFGLFYHAL